MVSVIDCSLIPSSVFSDCIDLCPCTVQPGTGCKTENWREKLSFLTQKCLRSDLRASHFKGISWGSIPPDTPSYSIVPLPPHFQMSSTASDCSCLQVWITSYYICISMNISAIIHTFFIISQLLKSSKKDISQINALWFLIYLMCKSVISKFNGTWYVTVSILYIAVLYIKIYYQGTLDKQTIKE